MARLFYMITAFALILTSLLTATQSQAAVYKCLSATGETSYSQQPCPEDATAKQMTRLGSSRGFAGGADNDCRLAQRFAQHTANDMRNGVSSGAAFNNYGGMSAMSGTAVSIANYVYSFERNYEATAERIAGLVKTRCESGSFGNTSCDVFPRDFVSSNGGCDLSRLRTNSREPEAAYAHVTESTTHRGATQEQYMAERQQRQCQKSVLAELKTVEAKAKAGLTSRQYDAYETQRQDLKHRFEQC